MSKKEYNKWPILIALVCTGGAAFGQGQPKIITEQAVPIGTAPITVNGPVSPAQQASGDHDFARMLALDNEAGNALFLGQYPVAEAKAREAKSVMPDSGVADEILGQALIAEGKNQEALQQYKKIVESGNNLFAPNLLCYALMLLKAGQWSQAVAVYTKAMPPVTAGDQANFKSGSIANDYVLRTGNKFSPDVPQPAELATAIHIGLGLTEVSYAQAPKDATAIAAFGQEVENKKLAQFEQAVQLSPDSGIATYYYGCGLKKLSRRAEATAAFRRVVEMTDGDVKAAAEKELKQ